MAYLSIFLLGCVQLLSLLFISKYFEYIYFSFYGLITLFVVQILSSWTNLWQMQISRFRQLSYLGCMICLWWLSFSSPRVSILFICLLCILIFSLLQSEIIYLIKLSATNLKSVYFSELIGCIFGVGIWYFFSATLGYKGFFYFCVVVLNLIIYLQFRNLKMTLRYLIAATLFALYIHEPQPIINKRERLEIVQNGEVLQTKWDTNGHVELIESTLYPDVKLISFEGGNLRSQIFKFDGNFESLKKDYLDSKDTGTWGLDVILPHFVKRDRNARSALISCVGGQEILAARAFGSSEISAIDINKSAQKIASDDYNNYNGALYSGPVHQFAKDGRYFIEHSNQHFDIIQIYSSESASSSSAMGSFFRPSSLVTLEALRVYDEHLAPDGILQITQQPFSKFKSTFEAAFGPRLFTESHKILAFSRANLVDDLVSIAYKKNGWSETEVENTLDWLNHDKRNKWDIIINPFSSADEKLKKINSRIFNNTFDRPASDNWPFFKIAKKPTQLSEAFWLFILLLAVLIIFFISFFRNRMLARSVIFSSFFMGITYSVAQSLFIFNFQNLVGLPSLGLCLAISMVLTLTAASALLKKSNFIDILLKPKFFISFALIFSIIFCFNKFASLPVLALLVFIQGTKYIEILKTSTRELNRIFWYNGLGFGLGILLFNLVFVFFGIDHVVFSASILYGIIALI